MSKRERSQRRPLRSRSYPMCKDLPRGKTCRDLVGGSGGRIDTPVTKVVTCGHRPPQEPRSNCAYPDFRFHTWPTIWFIAGGARLTKRMRPRRLRERQEVAHAPPQGRRSDEMVARCRALMHVARKLNYAVRPLDCGM